MSKIEKRKERAQHVNNLLRLISQRKPGHFAESRFEVDEAGKVLFCRQGFTKRTSRQKHWPGLGHTLRQFGQLLSDYITYGWPIKPDSYYLQSTTDEHDELLKDAAGSPVIAWAG